MYLDNSYSSTENKYFYSAYEMILKSNPNKTNNLVNILKGNKH